MNYSQEKICKIHKYKITLKITKKKLKFYNKF